MDGLLFDELVPSLDGLIPFSMNQLRRIVLVTNIPTPYRVPLFAELSGKLEARGYRLHVVFGGSGYARRKHVPDPSTFRFDYSFLDGSKVERKDVEKTSFLYKGLSSELKRLSPAVVIVSGFSAATVKIFLRSIFSRVPYIIWNGSIPSNYRKEGSVKRLLRKLLAARASAFVAYGSLARRYLVGLGADEQKVRVAINTVDASFFSRETEKCRREVHTGDGRKHLLTISYLSPRKHISKLIEAVAALTKFRMDVMLDIVGDGSDRAALEAMVERLGLKEHVRFHGHLQREELPALMANATLFLFQTDFDIWGLTLNEAMAAGLPVICSPNAGASADLIREGETGFIDDFSDAESSAALISRLLDDPEKLQRTGSVAASFISRKATLEISADGFVEAVGIAPGRTASGH